MANYDGWRTETDLDYHERMGTHRTGADRSEKPGGICACGADTLRSVGGIGWQCHQCGERAFHQLFQRGVRKAS